MRHATAWKRLVPILLSLFLATCLAKSPVLAQSFRDDKPSPPVAPSELSEEEYYELLRLLADTMDQVERNYVKEVDRRELVQAAIEGVISKLDQYSNYIPPEDLERFRTRR